MARRSEFQQIADLFAPLAASAPGALGLKDDGALLQPPPGCQVVVTVDTILCGVHYLPDDPPNLIAQKLVRVNLSDLAAMGATPAAMLLACAFPRECSDAWVEAFAAGLAEDVAAFSCPVIGGDTVATPGPATFSLTALGWVPVGKSLLRSGARAGDIVAVTGTIGDGAVGLWAAQGRLAAMGVDAQACAALAERYHRPIPRVGVGQALRGLASAAMDVSDGLVQDLGHMCAASGLCADLYAAQVPLSEALVQARQQADIPLDLCLTGGDDYELLFAVPPDRWKAAQQAVGDIPLTAIGRFVERPSQARPAVRVMAEDGALMSLSSVGWQHF